MLWRNLLVALTLILAAVTLAHADLDAYLNSLTVEATADLGHFQTGLAAHFGVPEPEVDLVLRTVTRPGDAALCLWLQKETRQPMEKVLHQYREQRGKGWGALAQSLGIKPGSDAFHALKRGDLGWQPEAGGKGKGKDKGHGKGNKK